MDRDRIIDQLTELLHLDIDATRAYGEAIERAEDQTVRTRMTEFRRDHERHASDLTRCITDLGAQVPEPSAEVRGFFIEGMTALRASTGTDGAMRAMRLNERVTADAYEDAIGWDVTPEVSQALRRGYEDERRHLDWIERWLSVGVGAGERYR